MKKTPGPRAPPDSSRPSRNITALSYSWKKRQGSQSYRDEEDPEYPTQLKYHSPLKRRQR
jgi:hypothetical protein